jgi:g-D-glutamyl-meso-diaminopimelate peptidase
MGVSPVSIGTSALGREIWAVRLGSGPARVLMTGAIHGREWVASDLLLRLIRELSAEFPFPKLSLTVVPMVNPDGVVAAERQLDRDHKDRQKSNSRGVDLNRNFDAAWNTAGTTPEPDFTDGNYPGETAFSEPETRALRDLVLEQDPAVLLDWHYRGGLIDLEHGGPVTDRLAEIMARHNGYRIVPGLHYPASGTWGDWFRASHPDRSALAIEIRHGDVERDWPENREAILQALAYLDERGA